MKNYAIIIGGELRNKGAQAMSFQMVSFVKRYLPELEPLLISSLDGKQPFVNRVIKHMEPFPYAANLRFGIQWGSFESMLAGDKDGGVKTTSKLKLRRAIKLGLYVREKQPLIEILKASRIAFDISGFAFSSKFGYERCLNYLGRIDILRKYNIITYLMPQSYGPFEFDNISESESFRKRSYDVLQYPRVVFARERQGYKAIKTISQDANCVLEEDIVLAGDYINPKEIFYDVSFLKNRRHILTNKNVGIVPNANVFHRVNQSKLLELYWSIGKILLDHGYTVYIIQHAEADSKCCSMILDMFDGNASVVLLNDDRYCFEYEDLFEECDFLIASRYHSIVHAYRRSIPCISIGWATKYKELLTKFDQVEHMYELKDVETMGGVKRILEDVRQMADSHSESSSLISSKIASLKREGNAFNYLIESQL